MSITCKIEHAMKSVTKEMEMTFGAKIDAKVALSMLKDRIQRMEKHQLAAKEQL